MDYYHGVWDVFFLGMDGGIIHHIAQIGGSA
jgi:hypothetical protein